MSVDMNAVSETRTICEILREIHDIAIEKGLDDIAYLAIEATLMAKKMSNKLLKRKERNEGH